MLSYQTVNPDTLELLRTLMFQPEMQGLRLVGGTSLALQFGLINRSWKTASR